MSYPLPLTRTEAYLAYKAGVIQQSELKPSLAVPRIGIDAWLAYWTQLANDYPKNPDGTPMILQEEEAYIAYLCGVIDTYPEECLRRVGAYLRYLISARWGRPDHPLNREELYLSLIKTQVIPSGDPSSDITINGTAKAPFQDVKMYGDTFQQTYTGKNLIDGIFRQGNKQDLTTTNRIFSTQNLPVESGVTYTISTSLDTNIYKYAINIATAPFPQPTENVPYDSGWLTSGTFSFTPSTNGYLGIIVAHSNGTTNLTPSDISGVKWQLEKSSSASSYEPYVGGQPSPNPDYPQPIQTVTGVQTVSINGTDYPINLGSIELCKIGTYQDYIWKDGESWKVHKDVGIVVYDGSDDENWGKDTSGTYTRMSIFESLSYDVGATRAADSLCDHFRADTVNAYGIFFRNNRNAYFYPQDSISLISEWRTWLSSNNIIVYYPLRKATDTTITDQTLIAQLDSLVNGGAEDGTTYIKVNATDPNLPGLLYVEAPKYE